MTDWIWWFADQHPVLFLFLTLVCEVVAARGLVRAFMEDFEL